jgi:hypothetical protein
MATIAVIAATDAHFTEWVRAKFDIQVVKQLDRRSLKTINGDLYLSIRSGMDLRGYSIDEVILLPAHWRQGIDLTQLHLNMLTKVPA